MAELPKKEVFILGKYCRVGRIPCTSDMSLVAKRCKSYSLGISLYNYAVMMFFTVK